MEQKLALVTGGLSGIGKATVLELAKKGYKIIIFDIQDEKATDVINECKRLGAEAVYKRCNLLNTQEIKDSFQFIKENYGNLDCALNNAGFGIPAKPFGEVTEEEIEKLLGINVKSYMQCIIHEIHMMKENGFGRIVNVASGAGLHGGSGMALYTACKHAVVGLTKSVALDYAQDNITVNAIAPGAIETELIIALKEKSPEDYKHSALANPIGRFGKPHEIARVVSFLFEEDSAFINGTTIPVDSGYAAGRFKNM